MACGYGGSFVDNFPNSSPSKAIKQVVRSVDQLVGEDLDEVLLEDMAEWLLYCISSFFKDLKKRKGKQTIGR